MKNKVRSFVIYQITNLLNQHIYIGAHVTYNIYDKYMGSSKYLKEDIKINGRHNFKKDILFVYNNKQDMMLKEAELVDKEFCHRTDTYNKMVGGISEMIWNDMVSVKDKDGKHHKVYCDDPRYLSGELVHNTKGMATVRHKDTPDGPYFNVDVNDPRYISGELVNTTTDKVTVKDNNGNKYFVSIDDPRYLSGELVSVHMGKVGVFDKYGNTLFVSIDDPRYVSGELLHHWTGRKHTKDTKEKIGKANSINQSGSKNSQFGTCWITKDGENKKIKKEELQSFINDGWKKGRKLNKSKK